MAERGKGRFFVQAVCFLLGFFVLFAALSRLLNDKMGLKYDGEFFSGGQQYQVLFFGSSHMFNGVLPLQLYRDYGIAGYNLGMTNEYPSTTYWRMQDALNRQTPDLVVVDVYRALAGDKIGQTDSDLAFLHNSMDSMPLSLTKVQALADILDAKPWDMDQLFNFLFPLAQFHSRYNALTEDDYHPYLMETKGAMPLRVHHAGSVLPLDQVPAGRTAPLDSAVGEAYLRRMVELCAGKEIPILLLVLPYQAPAGELARLNSIAALADEYPNAGYLNLLYADVVDPATDFADAEGHLNSAGAAKVTEFLGRWICDRYSLADCRQDPAFDGWQQNLLAVQRQQVNSLAGADRVTALMLLVGQDLPFTVQLSAAALEDPATLSLLETLGVPEETLAAGGTLCWQSPGAPAQFGSGDSILVFDPQTGEELARAEQLG